MKNHILMRTNLAICFIIIIGFISITFTNYNSYKKIMEDDIENISKLTSSTIYSEIDSELTKPIFVGQTMANDTFLKDWLRQELKYVGNETYEERIKDYLNAFKVKYNYDSVFLISAKSNVYYYFEGVNKVVSPQNAHDTWYYNFLESNQSFKLNIDNDEVNQGELTVFVDCRIEDTDGSLMGVVGVGVKMSHLQELLSYYESNFNLEVFLINNQGAIQVDTDSDKIRITNLFDSLGLLQYKDEIIRNKETMEIHWYPDDQLDNCLITRYINNLDWYLIVEKNTIAIKNSFYIMLKLDIIFITIILALLLGLSTYIIHRNNRLILKISNTDGLTGLPNHKLFCDTFTKLISNQRFNESVLFLFDIDNFKVINDTKGHIFGNTILSDVGMRAKMMINKHGMVARWGGDEFVGVIGGSQYEAEKILLRLMEDLTHMCVEKVTISIGTTMVENSEDINAMMDRADKALYISKENGRNQITHYQNIENNSNTNNI